MPLFTSSFDRRKLYFDDDCPFHDLRPLPPEEVDGEPVRQWIEVKTSISEAEWQKLRSSGIRGLSLDDDTDDTEALAKLDVGAHTLLKMALWVTDFSFKNGRGVRYPQSNANDRLRWLGELFPPVAEYLRGVLDAHIDREWSMTKIALDPKQEPSATSTADSRTGE